MTGRYQLALKARADLAGLHLGPGVRTFLIDLAGPHRGAVSHRLYYVILDRDGGAGVVILRILHEGMDPALHLCAAPA